MKIQFDANQTFQLDAIAAVVDLFDGQPQRAAEFSVIRMSEDSELFAGQERTELAAIMHGVDCFSSPSTTFARCIFIFA